MIPKLSKDQFKEIYITGFEAAYAFFDALQQAMETMEQRVAHLESILAKNSHNSCRYRFAVPDHFRLGTYPCP
jgi:hypothetical protein